MFLPPINDLVFKPLFVREPRLLQGMLSDLLGETVTELEILNPELPAEPVDDKTAILDVRVLLADGRRVDVEVQVSVHWFLPHRLLYYWALDYSSQLERGQSYGQLTAATSVLRLVEPLFSDLDQLHTVFRLQDGTGRVFSDHIEVHLLQLSKLGDVRGSGGAARWARLLRVRSQEELVMLGHEDDVRALASNELQELAADPKVRELARKREQHRILHEMSLRASHDEGAKEGRADGIRATLQRLLAAKFGPLLEAAEARLARATPQELEAWTDRLLTAATLDALLDG